MNIKSEYKPRKQKQKKQPKKITPSYLRNSGLYYLQRFTASSGHFKTVMLRKVKRSCAFHKDQNFEDCAKMVEDLTQDFVKEGLLDDAGYVRGMVTSLRRSGKSRRAITAKLQAKSVPAKDISDALITCDEDNYEDPQEAEFFAALKLARKRRLGPYDKIQKYDFEKALNIMARQGFSYDTSRRVLEINEEEIPPEHRAYF